MTIAANYKVPPTNEYDFDREGVSNDFESNITEFELTLKSSEGRSSKHINKRNFLAKKKMEQLLEDRRFRQLDDGNYDDWD